MKRLLYIFIPFLAILLMSHNASAFDINTPVTLKDTIKQPYISYNYVGGSSATSYSNAQVIRYTNNPNITRIFFKDTSNHDIVFNAGDYIVFNFYLYKATIWDTTTTSNVTPYSFIGTIGSNPSCDIIDIDFTEQQFLSGSSSTTSNIFYLGTITCHTNSSGTNPSINLLVRSNPLQFANSAESIRFSFSSMSIYTPVEQHDVNAEQEEATQEASDDSADAGDSSSSDAENASSSLISAIGGFVNAVTSASPSNCNINGDMGNMDLGTVDLCANPVPTFVQIISSLVLIAICIPFAIIMFNRFIGMFRSFQG